MKVTLDSKERFLITRGLTKAVNLGPNTQIAKTCNSILKDIISKEDFSSLEMSAMCSALAVYSSITNNKEDLVTLYHLSVKLERITFNNYFGGNNG